MDNDEMIRTLGIVTYVESALLGNQNDEIDKILNQIGGYPDIIYGQHVFESSPSASFQVLGGEWLFEGVAKIFANGVYIVLDNDWGRDYQIEHSIRLENSSKTRRVFDYEYDKEKAIYVFRKMED